MTKEDDIYKIKCIYCKNIYEEKIFLTDVIYITNCKKCGKDSIIEIGDVNFSTEVYRSTVDNLKVITTRKK